MRRFWYDIIRAREVPFLDGLLPDVSAWGPKLWAGTSSFHLRDGSGSELVWWIHLLFVCVDILWQTPVCNRYWPQCSGLGDRIQSLQA